MQKLEGKNLDRTIEWARQQAKLRKEEVWIIRLFEVRWKQQAKPILHISPQGDVNEIAVSAFRVTIAERALAQVMREGEDRGAVDMQSPAARLLAAFVGQR